MNDTYNVPHIDSFLAEHLKNELSADAMLEDGSQLSLLAKAGRSEQYLLGFLAGLTYGRTVINDMLINQNPIESDTDSSFNELSIL